MHDLSPAAEKAKQGAAGNDRAWRAQLSPRLARTATCTVILRPEFGGRQRRAAWAAWIGRNLPEFKFDRRLNRWQAPLDALAHAAEALLAEGVPDCNLSDGVLEVLSWEPRLKFGEPK